MLCSVASRNYYCTTWWNCKTFITICATAWRRNGDYYVLLGLEVQSFVDYAMPVRKMVYEAMRYDKQLRDIKKNHEKSRQKSAGKKVEHGEGKQTASEFLSGINKGEKLVPVITLILYLGMEKWDGPTTLHEMLEVPDDTLLDYISDYKLNLLLPEKIENFEAFKTELGSVLEAIKFSNNKQKMKKLFEQQEAFRHLERNSAMMIKVCTGMELEFKEEEEQIDMCKALREWSEEERAEGKTEALIELLLEGMITAEVTSEKLQLSIKEIGERVSLWKQEKGSE